MLSTDIEVGSVRDSVYCAAAVWSLYQAYRYVFLYLNRALARFNVLLSYLRRRRLMTPYIYSVLSMFTFIDAFLTVQ